MSSASTTTVLPVSAPSEAVAEPVETCDVCTHPVAGHDRTATRYCDATQQNALSRRCICGPLPTDR